MGPRRSTSPRPPVPRGSPAGSREAWCQAVLNPSSSLHPTDPWGLPHRLSTLLPDLLLTPPVFEVSLLDLTPSPNSSHDVLGGAATPDLKDWGRLTARPSLPSLLSFPSRPVANPSSTRSRRPLGRNEDLLAWTASLRPVWPAPMSLPTHQSLFPGAFSSPPGRQGCSPPALLRHEPLALRSGGGRREVGGNRREVQRPHTRPRASASPLAEHANEGLRARVARAAVRDPGPGRRGSAGGRAVSLSGRGRRGAAPARGEAATNAEGSPRALQRSRGSGSPALTGARRFSAPLLGVTS